MRRILDKFYIVLLLVMYFAIKTGSYMNVSSVVGLGYFVVILYWAVRRVIIAQDYLSIKREKLLDGPTTICWFIFVVAILVRSFPENNFWCTVAFAAGLIIFFRRKKLAKDPIVRRERAMASFCVGLIAPLAIYVVSDAISGCKKSKEKG